MFISYNGPAFGESDELLSEALTNHFKPKACHFANQNNLFENRNVAICWKFLSENFCLGIRKCPSKNTNKDRDYLFLFNCNCDKKIPAPVKFVRAIFSCLLLFAQIFPDLVILKFPVVLFQAPIFPAKAWFSFKFPGSGAPSAPHIVEINFIR